MRRVSESEVTSEFERQYCWGDDERYYYNSSLRKASVFGYHLRLREVLRLVRAYSPGRRVADLACAQGNFGLLLAEEGFDVTAVDLHPEFLRYARKKHERGNYRVVEANVIDYRDEQGFDCVLAGEIIEHVAFPDQLLRSVTQNLVHDGICVLTTPNGSDYGSSLPTYSQVTDLSCLIPRQFHWGDHLFLYTAEELRALAETAGLDVVLLEKYNSAYVSELKAIRYLLPTQFLFWAEKKTRHWSKQGKDSANLLIAVLRKRRV